jgi:hypothetical protein
MNSIYLVSVFGVESMQSIASPTAKCLFENDHSVKTEPSSE